MISHRALRFDGSLAALQHVEHLLRALAEGRRLRVTRYGPGFVSLDSPILWKAHARVELLLPGPYTYAAIFVDEAL